MLNYQLAQNKVEPHRLF